LGNALDTNKPSAKFDERLDPVNHILQQIEKGQTLAAADHLLIREPRDDLATVVQDLFPKLELFLREHTNLEREVFTALIQIGLNLVGRDVKVAQIPPSTVKRAFSILRENTVSLENSYTDSARDAANKFLAHMSGVNSGDSLPGYMAETIQKHIGTDLRPSSFVDAFATVTHQTIYWRMVEDGFCKFGNDYARGLEILRHLGFCQVSTNPVLAAKAFDEDSTLVEKLEEEVKQNPKWRQNPRAHGHIMVMAGTLLALWPNLEIFRPLAVLVGNRDYMISFQLNPNIADDAKASLEDARRAYRMAQDHLTTYDRCLGLPNPGKVPPNIVFKVAGSSKSARQVTRELNALGIGTNNTVTFAVAQEVQLIIDSLEGKSEAIKSGRPVTRTYETNMGGRFVSHLRETETVRIFLEMARRKGEDEAIQILMRLAKGLNLSEQELESVRKASGIAEKTEVICAYRNLKSLTHNAFLEAVSEAGPSRAEVEQLEMDLRKAGTLVARRVYSIFYENKNHGKWIDWLEQEHKLRHADAVAVLDSVDVLPASKRIPEDTYDTLSSANLCNTEFPNHAKAVQLYSERDNFSLASYKDAILQPPDPKLVTRLIRTREFVRGYELTKELSKKLRSVGLASQVQDLSLRGIPEEDWRNFGPVRKTMNEFKEAYDKFLERCVKLASATP
jgi:hypothetical protein